MWRVPPNVFLKALNKAKNKNWRIAAFLSDFTANELAVSYACYLTIDEQSGFAISTEGELCNLFSAVKGRGVALVEAAIRARAKHLNCFDGYLPELYTLCGFVEQRQETNWEAGEPDVVFMALGQQPRITHPPPLSAKLN